jgi:hypothetical protein
MPADYLSAVNTSQRVDGQPAVFMPAAAQPLPKAEMGGRGDGLPGVYLPSPSQRIDLVVRADGLATDYMPRERGDGLPPEYLQVSICTDAGCTATRKSFFLY